MKKKEFAATPMEINTFLREFKRILMTDNDEPEFIPRKYDFTYFGLDIIMAKNELLLLTYHHYDRGPTEDRNGDGSNVWEFGKPLDDGMAYIKLKNKDGHCKVLSFKSSTGPFTLPYKNW